MLKILCTALLDKIFSNGINRLFQVNRQKISKLLTNQNLVKKAFQNLTNPCKKLPNKQIKIKVFHK